MKGIFMGSNSFGSIFKMTSWGESHGKAMGVVIDGCPAGLEISEEEINQELKRRAPGQSLLTSPRKEKDCAEILSGIFEGKTTGAPISIILWNQDSDSTKYEPIKHLLRPGHANFTYLEKYGIFDYKGGGRASARETVCRVAAGAIAKKILAHFKISVLAYIKEIGPYVAADLNAMSFEDLRQEVARSPIFCPDQDVACKMMEAIAQVKKEGDSLGASVEFFVDHLPVGLGDPVYEKLEANLAKAMLSLPATKGFEIGSGFHSVSMMGSQHNDPFILKEERVQTLGNHAGGTLGGISNGMPLVGRVAFKPTSSIEKPQQTLDIHHRPSEFHLPEGSRHDPCVGIRAVPVVEAMVALVIVDALLLNRCVKL